jgi:hypothetical protein
MVWVIGFEQNVGFTGGNGWSAVKLKHPDSAGGFGKKELEEQFEYASHLIYRVNSLCFIVLRMETLPLKPIVSICSIPFLSGV